MRKAVGLAKDLPKGQKLLDLWFVFIIVG